MHHNDNSEHIVVEEERPGRFVGVRKPLPAPAPTRMTGPDRGRLEDARQAFVVTVPAGFRYHGRAA